MLLALIVCHLFALSFANPFHKYPFVFLLDVGNEELERVNTEQIRVSTPGGSIALRYPAVGLGDTISHVRVSGIDFGTDLKANIVDGGPGYKYVVLVFMGNPGKPYDAVLTVQTVPDDYTFKDIEGNSASIEENDANDSAEDLSDSENDSNQEYLESPKAEMMQSSSNVYSYAHGSNDDDSDIGGYVPKKDIHSPYNEKFSPDDTDVKDYIENEEDDESLNVIPKDERYDDDDDDDDNNNDDDNNKNYDVNSNDDDNDHNNEDDNDDTNDDDDDDDNNDGLCDDDKGKEQSEVYDEEDDPNYNKEYFESPADDHDSEEFGQTFNDDEVHAQKHKDSNNNDYEDGDDSSAIAY